MEVFEYEKCLLDRLEESVNVLSWKDDIVTASQVRSEWSYYIELQIEPAGWQALWKIPRVICEELKIRYPTVVFGYVEQVHFKCLKAVFNILSVQDENIHLPERHEVFLEDLWPTKQQENSELNIELTAECIDRLRFFYTYVWMPWDNDNDDDINWVEKHLESRIRLCYDLRKGTMKKTLAAHIRKLLAESKYLQQRREYLELGLTDEDEIDPEENISKTEVTDLMRLHLRLAIIRNEMELLENPEIRRIYQETKFLEDDHDINIENTDSINKSICYERVFIVMISHTLDRQIELLKRAKQIVSNNSIVKHFSSLQEVLNTCNTYNCIYLSPGRHTVKYLENMYNGGKIYGHDVDRRKCSKFLESSSNKITSSDDVMITSSDDESILFVFDGSFTLENLTLDCRNVRSGIVVKCGTVSLRNCLLIGDGKTSTQQAIVCHGDAFVVLENCTVKEFATGITIMDNAELQLNNSTIANCKIGIDMSSYAKCSFNQSIIYNSQNNGILTVTKFRTEHIKNNHKILNSLKEWKEHFDTIVPFSGECEIRECKVNIFVLNSATLLFKTDTLKYLRDCERNKTEY